MIIRNATTDDAEKIAEIYAPYVKNTAISYEYTPPTKEEMANRIENITKKYPWLVAEINGTIVGYAYASPVSPREAYNISADVSIYIKEDARHQGIGKALYGKLFELMKNMGVTNLYAIVAYTDREDAHLPKTSPLFHKAMGFEQVAHLHGCGKKFDKLYDIIWLEKHI